MKDIKLMLEYTKSLHVLYVENDLSLQKSTRELFSNYFKSVDVAINGQEGLEKYLAFKKDNDIYYDLIITDINMPKLNGIEMSEKILAINSIQSIIIITAHNENEYLSRAIELEVNGFISKPMDNVRLIQIFYKTAQAISDHKFIESHMQMMEELNIKLTLQNEELLAKNIKLEKSLRILDTMIYKEKLTHQKTDTLHNNKSPKEKGIIEEQLKDLIQDDLYELREILEEIDIIVIDIIDSRTSISIEPIPRLIKLFSRYSSILSLYSFFNELSNAIEKFSQTLKNNPLPRNEESIKNIFILLETFIFVLGSWHDDISNDDGSKINQFDASIISDMHTITNMWIQKEEMYQEGDMDEIFNF